MWLEFAQRNRYKLLLAALMASFIVVPTIYEAANLYETKSSHWFVFGISALLLMLATFAVSDHRRGRRIALVLTIICLFIEILATLFVTSKEVAIVHHILRILFFGYIIVEILRSLFRPNVVTFDTISASLCVYLLIGALWAHFYSLCEIVVPGSVVVHDRMQALVNIRNDDMTISFRMLYFSLLTLSTVGYGDVVPVSPMTRMLAVSEAIIGQIYLLVMVSRLVGLQVSQAFSKPDSKPEP